MVKKLLVGFYSKKVSCVMSSQKKAYACDRIVGLNTGFVGDHHGYFASLDLLCFLNIYTGN